MTRLFRAIRGVFKMKVADNVSTKNARLVSPTAAPQSHGPAVHASASAAPA